MDYATKAIVLVMISFISYCLLFQFELLETIFNSIADIIGSVVEPIKNLFANLT